ncbi:Bax inhibitor-1/YccA family protein [Fructilactobacillus vespulae]|uniref:Bax inhibitor-1/YccA family protein n=1 Tax=Fructilactobacillus vespulae TaxID=1249630 RepID=UPI0039B6B39B
MNGEIYGNTEELGNRLIAKTYQKVGVGLAITGVIMTLMATFMTNWVMSMGMGTSLLILVVSLGLMFALSRSVNDDKTSASTTNTIYYLMTILFGVSLSPILIYYRIGTIGMAMLGTAVMFGGLTFYANRTSKSYLGMGSYLMWGLIAAIVLSIVSVIFRIPGLYIIINIVMLVIFSFFIIFDTQSVRQYANYVDSEEKLQKYSTMGALGIYLDILNLFQILLQLFGMGDDRN